MNKVCITYSFPIHESGLVTFQHYTNDQKQQKIGLIKNMNCQKQSLVEVGPKGNNPTKYEAAAAKFGSSKR